MSTPRKPIAFAIHDSLKASLSEANLEVTQLQQTLEKRAQHNSDLWDRLCEADNRCIKVLDMYLHRDGMYDRLYDVASEFIFSCPEHQEETLDKLQSYFGYKGGA